MQNCSVFLKLYSWKPRVYISLHTHTHTHTHWSKQSEWSKASSPALLCEHHSHCWDESCVAKFANEHSTKLFSNVDAIISMFVNINRNWHCVSCQAWPLDLKCWCCNRPGLWALEGEKCATFEKKTLFFLTLYYYYRAMITNINIKPLITTQCNYKKENTLNLGGQRFELSTKFARVITFAFSCMSPVVICFIRHQLRGVYA